MNAKTVFALSAMFMVHAAFAALSEATTAVSSKSYSDVSMWTEGDYPDGRGATLAIGGSHTLGYTDSTPAVDQNVTLGSIVRKADTTPAYTMFFIPGLHHGVDLTNTWDPMYGAVREDGTEVGGSDRNMMTNTITLWATGDGPAVIGSKTPRFAEPSFPTGTSDAEKQQKAAVLSTVNAEAKKQVWMMIDMPLVLKSDLLLTHEGVVASQIGSLTYLTSGNRAQPIAAIELGGAISTPPGEFHDLIVSNPVYRGSAVRGESAKYIHNAVMLQGENTFKGNVRVKEGVLRLSGEAGCRGTIRQLGDKDNKVYVSAEGAVDLMGGRTPASHHLYLGGLSASATFGNLYSSDLDPLANAEWCGPVTLTGNAAIGGYPAYIAIASAVKNVRNNDGNLRVSGPIDGAGNLSVRGARQIEFSGDNSAFTGDIILDGTGARTRFLNASSLPATGRLVMNGGVVRVGAATDADVSTLGSRLDTTTYSKSLMLDIAEDVTYHPAQGFVNQKKGLAKTGKGKLVLDKTNAFSAYDFYFDEGETVFDFTQGATSLWGETASGGDDKGSFHLANDAHLTIKVPDDAAYQNHGFSSIRVVNGMFPHFTIETEKRFQIQNFNIDANAFLTVDPLEGAGDVVIRTGSDGGPMGYGNVFYGDSTFACRTTGGTYGTLRGFPDESYATTFDGVSTGASTSADSAVDVTAALVAGGPVSFTNRCLRFNTPNNGQPIVVNMAGFTNSVSGTILLTPNLGDTPVVFRGGALTAPADGVVRIVNLNTNANAYVEIDCDIVSGGWALGANNRAQPVAPRVNLVIAGKGRTVFRGNNMSNMNNYFIDCNIELPVNQLLANHTVDDGDNRDMCYVNGATFLATENINLVGNGYMGSKKGAGIRFEPTIGRLGMKLGATAGKTLTISRYADCYFKEGGFIDKVGAGTVLVSQTLYQYNAGMGGGQTFGETTFPTEQVMYSHVTGGTIQSTRAAGCNEFFGQQPIRIDVAGGVTFKGESFLRAPGCSDNSIALCDFGRRQSFVVPKNATVTFDRATGTTLTFNYNWIGAATPAMYAKGSGHFAGEGRIIVTDSVGTAKGINPTGDAQPNFHGTLRVEMPFITDGWTHSLGILCPKAILEIPVGVNHCFYQTYKNYFACRFGALSGSGSYNMGPSCDNRPGEWTFVGCDDASVEADFQGALGGGVAAQPLVKVGKSTQKFSGGNGNWRGSVMVRDGKLILGHQDAFRYHDNNETSGPFYWDYVLVGGDKVTAGMEPQFLVEGVETVKNPVRVLACADASVTPVVGVESGVTTISKLTVSNNVKVVANAAGSKVTIGAFVSKGAYDVSVGGAGEVAFAGNVTLPAGFGATVGTTFTTDGTLTVGDNAPFSLTVPGTLDPAQRYTLISAAGGITGTFDFSGVSLPTGWRVQQKANAVVLSRVCGMVIVFW